MLRREHGFSTVIVDATNKRKPHELHRDARDPQGDAHKNLERMADTYSRGGRTIQQVETSGNMGDTR
jgi:hypothetical protein